MRTNRKVLVMEFKLSKIDLNRLLLVLALIALALIAVQSNYRFEIGASGLTFERNSQEVEVSSKATDHSNLWTDKAE